MRQLRRLASLAALGLAGATAHAALTLADVRTAAPDVLVACFRSTIIQADEVQTTNAALWTLNGKPVAGIHKFVTEADACDHFIYLEVPRLAQGTAYTLETPHGRTHFVFDERTTLCESIKVNQVAYSGLSRVRYANVALWFGDGGTRSIPGELPAYTVIRVASGETVAQGTLRDLGRDESSGDHVYRIDLSAVPEGGPYRVVVRGYGCSYPFGVGGDFSRRLSHVTFRALYHQRCGCPVVEPYAWNIRTNPCHTIVYDTGAPIAEAQLRVRGDEPTFTAHGGYHDAGDADRRTYHMDVPATLLTTFEAFPHLFSDDQFNIPDRFNAEYQILGKGNGIPDVLDEAEWGTKFWEYVQKPSGEIHWGTETFRYSPFTTYDRETNRFGTEVLDPRSAGFASGLFLHLARALQPYQPDRSTELRERAERAFQAAGERIRPSHALYYAVQRYLLTGDDAAHQRVRELADQARAYADTYNGAPESFAGSRRPGGRDGWLASFFVSYLFQTNRPKDTAVVATFTAALKGAADRQLEYLEGNAYPVGTPRELRWWGSNVAQGQYAYPCLLYWALTRDQRYLDAASQLMDYALGLNPLGKCYVTGLGFNRVHNPHDRESAYTKEQGWGPRPGILVFGPGGSGRGVSVPGISTLPRERRFIDNLPSIQWTEFTVYQSLCFPAAVYPVLANGGRWDAARDPFVTTP